MIGQIGSIANYGVYNATSCLVVVQDTALPLYQSLPSIGLTILFLFFLFAYALTDIEVQKAKKFMFDLGLDHDFEAWKKNRKL